MFFEGPSRMFFIWSFSFTRSASSLAIFFSSVSPRASMFAMVSDKFGGGSFGFPDPKIRLILCKLPWKERTNYIRTSNHARQGRHSNNVIRISDITIAWSDPQRIDFITSTNEQEWFMHDGEGRKCEQNSGLNAWVHASWRDTRCRAESKEKLFLCAPKKFAPLSNRLLCLSRWKIPKRNSLYLTWWLK